MNEDERAEKVVQDYLQMVSPDIVRSKLGQAGLYVMSYELLSNSLVSKVRSVFVTGYRNGQDVIDRRKYKREVLARHRSRAQASALWFKEQGVLDGADVDRFERARQHRNELAHELAAFLVEAQREVDTKLLEVVRDLIAKVDVWWVLQFEVGSDPEHWDKDIGPEDVQSGNMILLDLIIAVAVHGYSEDEESVRAAVDLAMNRAKGRT